MNKKEKFIFIILIFVSFYSCRAPLEGEKSNIRFGETTIIQDEEKDSAVWYFQDQDFISDLEVKDAVIASLKENLISIATHTRIATQSATATEVDGHITQNIITIFLNNNLQLKDLIHTNAYNLQNNVNLEGEMTVIDNQGDDLTDENTFIKNALETFLASEEYADVCGDISKTVLQFDQNAGEGYFLAKKYTATYTCFVDEEPDLLSVITPQGPIEGNAESDVGVNHFITWDLLEQFIKVTHEVDEGEILDIDENNQAVGNWGAINLEKNNGATEAGDYIAIENLATFKYTYNPNDNTLIIDDVINDDTDGDFNISTFVGDEEEGIESTVFTKIQDPTFVPE